MRRLLAVYRNSDPLPPSCKKECKKKVKESEFFKLSIHRVRPGVTGSDQFTGQRPLWGVGSGSTHLDHRD